MKIFITGSAGFIGFSLAKVLLDEGHEVVGLDAITDYYDVSLKEKRTNILSSFKNFTFYKERLENQKNLTSILKKEEPEIILHLAAQAGVRYSLENPQSYIDSNILGTFNLLEICRHHIPKHFLAASTSSVYGANTDMPFLENSKADEPLTIYAATKKSTEVIMHSYSHLWKIPTTVFRFFTVYGPWGRPDMALFKFTKNILEGKPIEVYNEGKMVRDFTFIDDLTSSIKALISKVPNNSDNEKKYKNDTLSAVAPFRIVNIGNSRKVELLDFISCLEDKLDMKADKILMGMQKGDVPATWADNNLLYELTNFLPCTEYKEGVAKFVDWYLEYYHEK